MLMKGEGKDEDQTIAGQSYCETAGRGREDKGGYHYS
jgi:hypothetical protein